MRVAVVGCGYVGLVTGVGLASVGHRVIGIEADADRRVSIASGRPPFFEPGLADLLTSMLADGTFRVSSEMDASADADVVLLAVQTPPGDRGHVELGPLRTAAGQVATAFARAPRRRALAVRSTVVPGTTETTVAPLFDGNTAVASNPEFLAEGSAVADFLAPARVVVGCDQDWGRDLLAELYEPFGAEVVAVSPATAELSKYASNALLATLISFSNEIGRVAESLPGVDVEDVLGILHRDARLSPRVDGKVLRPGILSYLKAGCGYGGSCLPKDLSALLAHQGERGGHHPLLEAVRAVNDEQPVRLVDMVDAALGGLTGRAVTVLGVAFKAGTDDTRSSPGLRVVDELIAAGAAVTVYDPLVGSGALGAQTARGVTVAPSLADALIGAAACVITTLDPVFESVPDLMSSLDGPSPVVVDGRRLLRPEVLPIGARAVGRGPEAP